MDREQKPKEGRFSRNLAKSRQTWGSVGKGITDVGRGFYRLGANLLIAGTGVVAKTAVRSGVALGASIANGIQQGIASYPAIRQAQKSQHKTVPDLGLSDERIEEADTHGRRGRETYSDGDRSQDGDDQSFHRNRNTETTDLAHEYYTPSTERITPLSGNQNNEPYLGAPESASYSDDDMESIASNFEPQLYDETYHHEGTISHAEGAGPRSCDAKQVETWKAKGFDAHSNSDSGVFFTHDGTNISHHDSGKTITIYQSDDKTIEAALDVVNKRSGKDENGKLNGIDFSKVKGSAEFQDKIAKMAGKKGIRAQNLNDAQHTAYEEAKAAEASRSPSPPARSQTNQLLARTNSSKSPKGKLQKNVMDSAISKPYAKSGQTQEQTNSRTG